MNPPDVIATFDKDGPYYFLSNFAPLSIPIEYDEYVWPTTEHMYQALKTLDARERRLMMLCTTPNQAKKYGQAVTLRPDWEQVKDSVMLLCLRLKFRPGTQEHDLLLRTGDATLIEGNWWRDTYWGVCRGTGLNKLGKGLMQVREELNTWVVSGSMTPEEWVEWAYEHAKRHPEIQIS